MSRIYLTALAVVALAATSHAATISFSGFGEAQVGISTASSPRYVPAYFDFTFTMGATSGVLDLRRLDIYNDIRTTIGYSFAPLTIELPRGTFGNFGREITIDGYPFVTGVLLGENLFPPPGGPRPPTWSFSMNNTSHGGVPFTAQLFTLFPEITQYTFRSAHVSSPEPAGVVLGVMAALASCGVYRRSGRCG
jgi:hypothetical protein